MLQSSVVRSNLVKQPWGTNNVTPRDVVPHSEYASASLLAGHNNILKLVLILLYFVGRNANTATVDWLEQASIHYFMSSMIKIFQSETKRPTKIPLVVAFLITANCLPITTHSLYSSKSSPYRTRKNQACLQTSTTPYPIPVPISYPPIRKFSSDERPSTKQERKSIQLTLSPYKTSQL
ncbi:hypothetical protein VFPPC_18189 [Pochonia chlamydosporia 170]|uniref:Uncharacterized protein n=1 Tax=Pochonia chlamydosporia 170 TaxID=1380566 RepID=A0A219ANH3_METCM|nr:hypothetical protein VFPPC_18189 [Pochonia chlamydosporia 170]OWT42303.1 hypothetical protein VFPPC_18189 [Pochonia chlamydosporia 170]